jgi:hypothetical protein
MKRLLAALLTLAVSAPAIADYEVGQVWEYKTRPGEEASRIYIAKIDEDEKLGRIFHIYVDGLRIKNKHTDSGYQNALPHSPVDKSTLDASVTNLINIVEDVPDVSEGYKAWKDAFDAGQGGVFNIPVAQIIEYIEGIVNQ